MITFISWGTPIMGGVQNLILNISQELNTRNQKAKIFGYKTCLIYIELVKRKVDFEFIDLDIVKSNELFHYLTEEDVIVFGSYSPRFRLFMFKEANPRILYWNVMANKLTIANKIKFINFKYRTKKLINKLVDTNSLVFMDIYGLKSIESDIGVYLPIPVKSFQKQNPYLNRKNRVDGELKITYVGRASIWKMQPLKKIILDILNLEESNFNIHIHIITQEIDIYKNFLSDVRLKKFLRVTYHKNLMGDSFRYFLLENSDLHFAMGTGALDGGILGIPTIVVDYSMEAFPENYKYLWLYDTIGFDLGHPVNKNNPEKSLTMEEIILLFLQSNNKVNLISELTFNYVQKNHEIKNVVDKLLYFTEKTKGRVRTILKYTLINFRVLKIVIKFFGRDLMKVKK
jgi:hypothetical protein